MIENLLKKEIDQKTFSKFDLLVSQKSDILLHHHHEEIFDIASLTKPIVISSLYLTALKENKIDLQKPVQHYLSSYPHPDISIFDLLHHRGRQIAFKEYEKMIPQNLEPSEIKSWLIDQIINEPLEKTQKTLYSDHGFILLGLVLEEIYQKKLDKLFNEKIKIPLQLQNTFFDSQTKNNDPRVQLLDGVSSHAGLFSNSKDIHRWLLELRKSFQNQSKLFDSQFFKYCLPDPHRNLEERNFYFGFESKSIPSTSGQYFLNSTIGHLGFTGCSFWWDLEQDFWVILLTDRINTEKSACTMKVFRPKLHDLIFENLIRK